ncbi:hypothetical protein IMG5_148630 [Ichthyophthirius multifiliis]|uniref:EF-hand domain-containing protein n=1 Tax=Ichthyophthirius multifiliis TaxID=5932 RepID=G0QYB9_ICHMU|nr:hypothetical protein IMG5_148630 [Ichthyophthirius multifiliis]EGR29782.1 hypothetical protein IMG5_148630 [Ichthyophthirius multifiliis]|eukprot:XP_004031018.1 hypothetical protein IMG5_148630 [Ichthyophthirius multifiliis]
MMRQGQRENFDNISKEKIKQYIFALTEYIQQTNFFDPFESMQRNGQLSFKEIYEALKNGYPIFQSQEDIKLLANANMSGAISKNELKLQFGDIEKSTDKENKSANDARQAIKLSQEIEDQIRNIFKEVDKDGSGYVDLNEFDGLLRAVGINVSQDEQLNYFNRFDKNNDGQISFLEFKIILEEKIKQEILTAEDIIDDLRKEFFKVDLYKKRVINFYQLGQVLSNLNVNISQNELEEIFKAIDIDQSGFIDIDEFLTFLMKNNCQVSSLASSVALNVSPQSEEINVEIKLDYATGIPLPKDDIPPESIVYRQNVSSMGSQL